MKKTILTIALVLAAAISFPTHAQLGGALKKAKDAAAKKVENVTEKPANVQQEEEAQQTQSSQQTSSQSADDSWGDPNITGYTSGDFVNSRVPRTAILGETSTPEQPWEISTLESRERGGFVDGKLTKGPVTATLKDGVLTIKGTGIMQNFGGNSAPRPWGAIKSEIKSVVIEKGIRNIGRDAFIGCDNLVSITMPDDLAEIGDAAFTSCTSLKTFTIPKGLNAPLKATQFENCTSLTKFISNSGNEYNIVVDGILYDKKKVQLIRLPGAITGEFVVPAFAQIISGCSFMKGLTSVVLHKDVTSVRGGFEGCTGLQSITCYSEKVDAYGAFAGVDVSKIKLYVPATAINSYKTSDWKNFDIHPIQ